jgi:hypothetical protein
VILNTKILNYEKYKLNRDNCACVLTVSNRLLRDQDCSLRERSANGDVKSGLVGGSVAVTACTPMEKEVANQLAQLSDWYRTHWDSCGTNSDPAICRADLAKAYQEQQQSLLDVLASMNGKSNAEQEQIYRQMQLNKPTLFK